jgi:UDP-N-acetylmuramate dehydrogenase
MDSGYLGFEERFSKTLGKNLEREVPLQVYANFKVGGRADYFFAATSLPDLVQAVLLASRYGIPHYVIGGAYNLLFDDEGFRGLIVRNEVRGIKKTGVAEIEVFSGTPLRDMLKFCVSNSMKGFEFLAGIPGTTGGAVFGNAGAFEQSIGDFLSEALVLDNQGVQVRVDRDYFVFGYRQSRLRDSKDLLLRATFTLEEGDQHEIQDKISLYLAKREKKHPPEGVACAGSFFKNPVLPDGKRVPAAYFLDNVGAKDLSAGGAAVFSGHANFIINRKDATARDILSLARELKDRVKKRFGIQLEEEVIFLPAKLR